MAAYFKFDHTRELINTPNQWRFLVYEIFQTFVALVGGGGGGGGGGGVVQKGSCHAKQQLPGPG